MDSLDELARALTSGRSPTDDQLQSLTGLEGEPLLHFQTLWTSLEVRQRADLVQRLAHLAEEDLLMDFMAIGAIAMEDGDPSVRQAALRIVSQEATPALMEPCLRLATADPDEEVRLAAVEALGTYALATQADGWPADVQQRLQAGLLAELRRPESDRWMRGAALLSLAYLTTPEVETEIRRAYSQPDLRQFAIEAMGRNCQEIWIPELTAALEADDPDLRLEAVFACIEMESESVVPDLITRVRDKDEEVRLAAIEGLGIIGSNQARAALDELQWSSDPSVAQAAREALDEALSTDNPLGLRPDRN